MTRRLRQLLVAGLLATLVMLVAAPADAARWSRHDSNNTDMGDGDIAQVSLNHSVRRALVRIRFYEWDVDGVSVYVDTRRQNAGPEFRLDFYYTGLGGWMTDFFRVDDFAQEGRHIDCAVPNAGFDGDVVWFPVARSCLRSRGVTPKAIRVTVRSADDGKVDWAPRYRAFAREWVRAG